MTWRFLACAYLIFLGACAEAETEEITGTWMGRCSNPDEYIGFDADFELVLEEAVESELTGAGTVDVMDLRFRGEVWGLWAPPVMELWFEGKADKETISLEIDGEAAEDGGSITGDCAVWGVWGDLEMSR